MNLRFLIIIIGINRALVSSAFGFELSAPDGTGPIYFLGAKYHHGSIITDSPLLKPLSRSTPWMIQMEFSVLKNTQQAWDYCNCYSKNGVGLSFSNFNNPEKLGTATSLIFFTEPLLYFSDRIQFSLRGGSGISYLNKVYHADTNPENLFYSNTISFFLMLNFNLYYSISQRWRAGMTGQFSHISNGGTKWPNYGMNYPTLAVGLDYLINPQRFSRRTSTLFSDRSLKSIVHAFGVGHKAEANGSFPLERKLLLGANAGIIKPLTKVNALGLGGELYYDGVSEVYQDRTGKNYTPWTGSFSLQHYIFFGKILFGQQVAYAVTALNPDTNKKVYQRYFLEYKVSRNWYAGITLKAYGGRSDYLAFTSGIIL
jgi:Lipid A 3-O-deacylase (PagL)